MQQPTPDQAIRVQAVVTARWVARAETRGLRIGTWVLILGSLALPRPAGTVVGAINLLVILGQVAWSALIAARARRELAQADPARMSKVFEQLRSLPGPRRTFEALRTALAGAGETGSSGAEVGAEPRRRFGGRGKAVPDAATDVGPSVDDGLTCYERGGHVPGCPHRPLDGSGLH